MTAPYSLNKPITHVDRAEARRRVDALILRRPPSRIPKAMQQLAKTRRLMVKSWAAVVVAEAGLELLKDIDKLLGQEMGTMSQQAQHGAIWPSAWAQSRAAERWGVTPIGVDPYAPTPRRARR